MPPRRKRDKVRGWLSSLFAPNNWDRRDGSRLFEHAQDFVVNNSNVTSVQGDQNNTVNDNTVNNNTVINIQVDHTTVTQIMSLLSQHIIRGAAHDDSARTPPPRCHPNTRVKLIGRITTWFNSEAQQELLLWVTGPASVGKSAIVQTFAEYLAKSDSLGASVFISRPNKRNDPNGIFITIAYQLATRIEEYRKFLAERLSVDPSLLNKGMEAQFLTFIVEPFVEKKIGAGGKRWGILLDGLDELRGEDAQCDVIHLISMFVHEHRDTPLVWIIASRPESHISNMFDDDEVRPTCWVEYIPIDSTEACADVERFLRSSFKTTRKKYRQSVSSDWPSDTDFLKLTVAASGLFVYAQVVMEFIKDPDQADPALRFEVLISVISRSHVVPTKENPFVHLDALYHEILSLIPATVWPATRRLLGFRIYEENLHHIFSSKTDAFSTLKGMSILFNLSRNTVYACLTKCRSVVKIPDWKVAHKQKLTFLHASFADYLKDSSRSADFYVGDIDDFERVIVSNLVQLWKKCSGDDIAPALIKPTWLQHCSNVGGERPSSAVAKFHARLLRDIVYSVARFPRYIFDSPDPDLYERPLLEVHMAKLCYYLFPEHLADFIQFECFELSSNNKNLCRNAQLGALKFGHLDWKGMSPAKAYEGQTGKVFKGMGWILNRPRSSAELTAFVSELEEIQQSSPGLEVVVFGGVPSGRVITFPYELPTGTFVYYAIPYPE